MIPERETMKRISLITIALCLPLVLCGPAHAQHFGPYVGAFFGGDALMSARSNDDLGKFSLTFDPGMLGGAVAGWDFAPSNPVGEGRIELEYTRRSNQLDKVKFVEGTFKGSGKVTADSLLVDFIGVMRDKKAWAPYAGIGLGAARMEASDLKVTGQPFSSGTSVVFAYQFGTGVDFTLTDHLNLDIGYRFFGTVNPKFTEASGRKFEMDYFSHNVILGLRVGF